MAEPSSMSAEDSAAARAAEQARLRKERREAKIKAGGASRLNKITGLGGGIQRGTAPGLSFYETLKPRALRVQHAPVFVQTIIEEAANLVSQIRHRRRQPQRAHQPPPPPPPTPTRVRSHPRNSPRHTRTQTRSISLSTSTTPKPHNESPHSPPWAWTMRSYGR